MNAAPDSQRSSTLLISLGFAALFGAAVASLFQERRIQTKTEELDQTREALRLTDETLAVHREINRKLAARLAEMNATTNSMAQAVRPLPTPAPAPEPVVPAVPAQARWTAADAAHHQAQVPAPAISLSSSSRNEQKVYTFSQLPAADGRALMTAAEYRGSIGRKLMFRSANAAARSFDYSELHPGVLAHLSLEPADLKAQQSALDDKKQQAEYAAQKAREAKAVAEKKYQEALLAVRVVQNRIAAEQKKVEREENLRLQALETERMKAEAAMLQAEAAMEKARNPQPVLLFDTKHMGLAPLVNPQVR